MAKAFFLSIIVSILYACTQEKHNESDAKSITGDVFIEQDSFCLKKNMLIDTVLNHPDVIRFSKLQAVRKAYDTIYINFIKDDINCIKHPYLQKGDTLKVIYTSDSINTRKAPIYEFSKIDIQGDSAYVVLEFDITGALAFGSFKQISGKWLPDSNFVVGFR